VTRGFSGCACAGSVAASSRDSNSCRERFMIERAARRQSRV
jgi:hypothetical protein